MNEEYGDCLKKGKIKAFSRGKDLASSEIEAARSDLARAEKTFKDEDYKWTTVQLYYSMFHAARALLYSKNLREHSHFCLIQAMKELFVTKGAFPVVFIEALTEAKNLREDADYYNRWSREACEKLLKKSVEFLKIAEKLVKKS